MRALILLAAFLFAAGPAAAAAIMGQVTNVDTGAGLGSVTVDILNAADESVVASAVTDAFGTYSISPGAGTYHIRTQPTGYFPSMRFSYSYDATQTITLNFALQPSSETWRDDFSDTATPPTGWNAQYGATQFTSAGNIMLFRTAVTGGPGVYHGVKKVIPLVNAASFPYLSMRHKYALSAGSFGNVNFIFDYSGGWAQRINIADNLAAAAPWQDRTFPTLTSFTTAFLLQGDGPAGSNTVDHYFDHLIAHGRARGYIRGTVRDNLGLPLAGARVEVLRGNAVVAEGFTDASGAYDVAVATQAVGTPYTLRARRPAYDDSVSGNLAVGDQSVTTADLTLHQSLAGTWFTGSGKDGALSVNAARIENSTRTAVNGAVPAGVFNIPVANTGGFSIGDLVMVIQMFGTGAGQYEFARVQSLSGNINLTRGVRFPYQATGAQVLRVQEYSQVSVSAGANWTAPAWNGTTGGVFAAVARGPVTVTGGSLSMTGLGFTGGAAGPASFPGYQGFGFSGNGTQTTAANGNGGGGGGIGSGGGGGGNLNNAASGTGASPGLAGGSAGLAGLSTMLPGGGGGGGGGAASAGSGAQGGAGGGIIMLVVGGDVTVSAGGLTASAFSGGGAGGSAGSGGGGSGGSIRIVSTGTVTLAAGVVNALGGGGGTGGSGNGGVGASGRIAILQISTPAAGSATSPAFDASSSDGITFDDPYTAPRAVTDLRVGAIVAGGLDVSSITVRLTWSAPGADGSSTTIQNGAFTVRYSPSPILSDLAFAAAPFTIDIATTGVVPGSTQTIHIGPLDPTVTWYFAVKTTDTWAMTSALSNPATAQARQSVIAGSGGRSYGISWGDYDRDGIQDLGVGNGATDGSSADQQERFVKVYPDGRTTITPYQAGDTTDLAFGDLDGDGDPELVIANGFGAAAANQYYVAGGSPVTLPGSDQSLGVALADFDNDGDLDIFYANDNSASLIYFNDAGAWTPVSIPGTAALRSIGAAAADFDGDGRMDVAVAVESVGSAYVVFNEGGRNFSTANLPGTAGFGRGVAAADLDGDGRPDIALAYSGAGDEMVVRNNGGRSFGAAAQVSSTGGNSERIAAADYDNDGDIDLVVTNLDIANRLLRNDGNFSFTVSDLPKTPRSRGVAWADFDDDGDADLAVANDGGAGGSDAADEFLIRNDTGTANAAPVPPGPEDIAVMFAYDPAGSTLTFAWKGGAYDGATATAALNFDIAVSTLALDLHTDPRHFAATLRSFVVPPADRVPGYGFHQRPGFKDWTGEGFPFHAVQVSSKGAYANSALQWNTTYYLRVAVIDPGLARSSWSAQKAFYLPDPCATNYSRGTGSWSNRDTWATGVVPYSCTPVDIQPGHDVTVDITTATVSTTTVYGRLSFARLQDSTLTMVGGGLDIRGGGVLDMGTAVSPVTGKARLNLAAGGNGVRFGLDIQNGGRFWAHGSTRTPYAFAVESIPAGGASFKVSASSSIGWAAGDIVAVGATAGTGVNGVEFASITVISGGDPRTVTLEAPLSAARVFTASAPIVIANLTRNVVIRSSGTVTTVDTAYLISNATSTDGFESHHAEFYRLGCLSGGAAAGQDGVRVLGPAHVSSSAFHQGHAGVLAASAAVVFEGNSFVKNAGYGLTLTSLALGASVYANASLANAAGGFSAGSPGGVFSWNITCSNGLRGFDGFRIRSWFTDNTVCLNSNGGMVSGGSDDQVALLRNRVYGNSGDGINVSGSRFVLEGNSSYANVGDGIEVSGAAAYVSSNSVSGNSLSGFRLSSGVHQVVGNAAFGNTQSGFLSAGGSGFANNFTYANGSYGLDVTSGVALWSQGAIGRDPSLAPAPNAVGSIGASADSYVKRVQLGRAWVNGAVDMTNFKREGDFIMSVAQDRATGTVRVHGDAANVGGYRFEYATHTHGAGLGAGLPALLRGDGHALSVVSMSFDDAVTQGITVEYRSDNMWHVDGSVSGPDMAVLAGPGTFPVPAGTPQFTMTLTQGAAPQAGDRLVFIVASAAQDAGVQKRLLFSDGCPLVNNGRSRYRTSSPLVFRGVPGFPTIVDRLDAGTTYFTFVSSGDFYSAYSSFSNLDGDGLQLYLENGGLVSLATTTFDSMGFTSANNAYLTVADNSVHVSTTHYGLSFGNSRSTASVGSASNIRMVGPNLGWTLRKWGGAMGGQARESDLGSALTWAPFTPGLVVSSITAASTGSVSVQWAPGLNDSGIFYEVQANTTPFANGAIAATIPVYGLAGTVDGLLPNTSYFLRVFATNQWGSSWWEAEYSNNLDLGATATLAITPSTGAAGAFSVFGTSATLGWAANPAVPLSSSTYGYRLEASSTDFNGAGSVYSSATTSSFVSTLTVSALERNTTYYFRVGSLNEFGVPNFIALGSSSTRAPLLAAGSLAVFVTSAAASWTALPASPQSLSAEGYRLEASSTNFGAASPGGTVYSTATAVLTANALTVAGLTPYVTYYFRVGAVNWEGAVDFSVSAATMPTLFRQASVPVAPFGTFGAAWADADGDGDLDLAIANSAGSNESVLRNDGAGGFTRMDIVNAFGDSRGLAWGDFDLDGDLDFAVANAGTDDEKVMRNMGFMVFQETTLVGTGGDSRGLAAGDFDNDGDLDLAVANAGGQNEVLLRNDAGSFITAAFPATGGDSNAVAWGDYDNDGDLDLAVSNAAGEDEVLVRNDSGTFALTGLLAGSGGDSAGLAWGDSDGDGDLDLAVADAGAASFLMRNDGASFVKILLPAVVGSHKGVAWGDLDNDGDLDLVFTSTGGAPTLMFNEGGASFIARQMPEGGPTTAGVSFGDYDNDGDLDLGLGTDNASLDPKVLRNDGQPGNTPPTAPAGGFNASFTELAPFSSSGVLRLSWASGLDGQTPGNLMKYWVRVGTTVAGSSETMKVPPALTVDGYSGGSWAPYATRFGAGNSLKLVVAKETTAYWAVTSEDLVGARSAESTAQTTGLAAPRAVTDLVALARVSTGLGASTMTVTLTWTAPGADGSVGNLTGVYDIRWSSSAPLTSTSAFVAAPFGAQVATASVIPGTSQFYAIPDLAAYATWYFALSTLDGAAYPEGVRSGLSNPATSQSYATALTGAATARRAAWGDADGDGDLDLALAQAGNDSLYRNDGGTFTPVLVTVGGDSYGASWGDYDGDGDLDLLVANTSLADEYLLNNSAGVFAPGSVPGTGGDTYDAAWADYDNDGDLDAALAQYNGGVLLLRSRNDGTFAQVPLVGMTGVTGVAWGDYDGDGDLDLAVASDGGDEGLYRTDGSSLTMVAPNPFAGSGGNTWKAAWGDLDNDGRLDIVFANYNNFGVRVYRNTGGGTFSATTVPGTGDAYDAALADIDGDGDLDIALARGGAGEHELILRNDAGAWNRVELASATAGGSLGAAWGDYDGDGDPDLAVANDDADSVVARNDRSAVNTAPTPPVLSAADLAFEYGLQGATLTVKWDAGDYDSGRPTASLHYQLAATTLPMTVSGDSKRLTGPSSFVVPWQFGTPGWGTHINTAYQTWPGDAGPKLGRLLRVAVPEGRLANDATYYFRVQTIDAELARGGWSNEVSTFVFAAVPATGRTLSVHASSVSVSYSTVTGGTRYIAEAFTDAAFSVVAASAATADLAVSSLAPAGLGLNTTYYLRMGVLYSRTTAYAASVPAATATPAAFPATAASTFPVVNSASMTVVWDGNGNPLATAYEVVLSTDSVWPNPSTMTVTLATAPAAGPAATLAGLANYTTYYLFVRAVGHDGNPTAFVALGSTRTAVDLTPPAALTDLRVATAALTGAFVALEWSAPGDDGGLGTLDAGEYRVQYATYAVAFASADAQVIFSTTGVLPGQRQGTRVLSLNAGSTYYFRAWTRDDVGQWSALSNGATVYLSWTAAAVGAGGKQVSAAVGPDGKQHVFYNDGGTNLVHASRLAGQPWATETAATGATETGVRNASVVDASGTVHLLMAYGTPAGNLGYTSWNGSWSPVWLVDGSASAIDSLAMAVDAEGVVHAAHSRAGTLYYSTRSVTGGWGIFNLGAAQVGGGVSLTLRPDGAPLILYANGSAKLRLLDWQGSGFVARTIDDAADNQQAVGLVYDRDGLTAAAFKNSVDNTLRIDTAPAPSGPWAQALAQPLGSGNPYLSFALDGTGSGELLYMENTAARSLTGAGDLRRIRIGDSFSDDLVGPAGGVGDNAQFPAVYIDTAGVVHAAYPDSAGTGVLVASSAFVTAAPPGPLAPGAFGAAAVYQTSVSWSWTDRTPNEAGFRIYGGTAPPYGLVASTTALGPGSVSFQETGLFANATYFRYAAVVSSGGAGMSVGTTVVTGAQAPSASTFTAVSSFSVTVAWSGGANSAGTLYEVQRSSFGGGFTDGSVSTAPEGAPAASFASLANTAYDFRVRTIARNGVPTGFAATVSTATPIETPSAVLVDAVSSTTLLLRAAAVPAGFTNLSTGAAAVRFVVGGTTLAWATASSMTFVTGLTPNAPITVFARARNLEGTETADSPTISTYTLAAVPSTATPVFVNTFVSSVSLQWTHNGNPAPTEYRVGASTAADYSGSSDTVSAWLTGTSTQPASLTANTTLYFRVQARSGAGAETAYADLGSTVTLAAQPGSAATAFTPVGQSSMTVHWTLGLNPAGTEFMARASTASDFTGTVLNVGWLSALTTTFTGLSADTTYYWTVGARNRAGRASQLLDLGAQATLPFPPAASTQPFHAVWVTSANVQWTANGNQSWTQYQAEASTDPAYGTSMTSGWTAFLSTTVTGLMGDATYFWRVRSRGVAGFPVDYLPLGSPPQGAADPVAPRFSLVAPASVALEWGTGGNRAGTGSGPWSTSASLPVARERHSAALLNGRIYVTGGIVAGTASAEVWSAPVSEAGAVGAWSRHVDMPAPRESHALAVQAGRLYVLGGFDGVAKDTVYWAPVSPDGSVGDWRQGRSLPAARFKLAAVSDGGWLYAIGGDNGVIPQSTVYAAPVAADGSIGVWTTATALPSARNSHAAAVAEGFVFVSGGLGAGLSGTVWSAPLAGSSVGPWTAEASMGTAVFRHTLLAIPGRLVVLGGHDGNAAVATVQQAPILGGGTLGAWGTYGAMPLARFGHSAVRTGRHLVSVGGSDGAAATADSFYLLLSGTEYLTEFAQDSGYTVAYGSTGWRAGAALELSGLTPNTTYFARTKARTQAGAPGAFVDDGSTTTLAAVPATAPSTFTAVFEGSMTVTWAANNNPAGTEFMAGLSTSSDFTTMALTGWTTAVSSTVFGLNPNTTYFAAAVARNRMGVETPALALGTTMTLAAVPQDSSFTAVGGFGFTAVWSTAGNPAGTRYEAQVSLADTFSPVAASSLTVASSAQFLGLLGSSTYYLRVRALNGRGAPSAYSATTATITGLDVSSPAVVGGLSVHPGEAGGTLLALWTSPGDDGSSGALPAGSRFYLQWVAGDPPAVAWSTANAQLSVSTGPLPAGSSSSMLVPGLPVGSWVTVRVWTLDDGGMVSDPSPLVRAFASPFDKARLDGTGTDAGRGVSLAVDRAGDAHATYTAGTVIQELRYLKRGGGVWGVAEGPDPGIPAADTVVAVDWAGLPQVLYRNSQTGQLRHARRAGSWSVSAVASGDLVPGGLVLDATGQARITYYDASAGDLLFAARDAGVWQTEAVDSAGDVGRTSSLALDADGTPHVAYFDATNGNLKFASRTAPGAWAVSTVDPAAAVVGSAPALALDGLGGAFVAYLDSTAGDLKVARYDGSAWSSWVVDSLSTAAAVGGLALDGAGNPLVSYYDGIAGDLLFARYDGTVWSTGTLDSLGDRGAASSLSVDAAGEVQVLHYDASAGDLYSARWNAGLAAPYGGSSRGRLQAPAALTGIVASSTTVQWTWTDSAASELGWRVYGSLSSTGPYTLVAGTAAIPATAGTGSNRSYMETGLAFGTTYYRYVVAVASGGFAASPVASTAPFVTADVNTPAIAGSPGLDPVWRRAAGALYNVDFTDTGGSLLSKFQVRASTVPNGTGPVWVDFTDVAGSILSDSYTADWALPAPFFSAMADGATNYISVRVFDGAGNSAVSTDTFSVMKDTTPPAIQDWQGGDPARRAAGGTLYDVDARDPASGLERFQYSVSLNATTGDAGVLTWTDIPLAPGASSYAALWGVSFAPLVEDATNYVSLRAWDMAGSTAALVDAFYVVKDTAGPRVGFTMPASAFRSVLTLLSGTAADAAGVGGVEVAIQTAPTAGAWWNGAAFASGVPVWLAASGTASWTLAAVPAWTDGGSFRLVARASDTLGNYSAPYSTADFSFDASSPTVGVTTPLDASTPAALPAISGTALDPGGAPSGLSLVEVRLSRVADGLFWNWTAGGWTSSPFSTTPALGSPWTVPVPEALRASLAHGASYFISVRAADGATPVNTGSFAVGSTFTWTDTTPPAALSDLTGLSGPSPGEIGLAWTAPGEDGALGGFNLGQYRIHYSTDAAAAFSTGAAQVAFSTGGVVPGAYQGRLLSGLLAGSTYHLRVFMADDSGNWSALSNGATVLATPQPFNKITGHVMKTSSEGVTSVLMEAFDAAGARVSSAYSLADGSGTYSLDDILPGVYRVQASWTAGDVTSSVWLDNIAVGSYGVDFFLEVSYTLSSLTGSLGSSSGQALGTAGFLARAADNAFQDSRVQLLRGGSQVAEVRPDPTGRWVIPNLLPGKYAVRAYNGLEYSEPLPVELGEGETREVVFVFDPLPEAQAFAFPNPARDHTTFRFVSGLPGLEAQVSVFDIAGVLVKEIPGSAMSAKPGGLYHAVWDLSNDRGEGVASGVYLFMVKVRGSNGQAGKVVKKLAIVR